MRIAIIIPCYNEEKTIKAVVEAAQPYGTPIVVDDASSDESARLAAEAGAEVVRHHANRGYDGALQSGFERADEMGFQAIATLDGDGQLDAAVLGRLLAPIREGRADLVLGRRPKAGRVSEAAFNGYTRLRFGVPDILCGQKSYNMELFREHGRIDSAGSIGTQLALWALRQNKRHEIVSVPVRPRVGKSRIGSSIRANNVIFRALFKAIAADIRGGKWA